MFDALDRFLGHRPKVLPPVLINRDFELLDDDSVSRSEFGSDDPSPTPRPGVDEEGDPHLTGSRHRAGKKKCGNRPDHGRLLKEVVGTLEVRWKKEDEREDARAQLEREDNDRFFGILSNIAACLEKMMDKNN